MYHPVPGTLKKREREIGQAVEDIHVACSSCVDAAVREKDLRK